MRARKLPEQKLFNLTPEERKALEGFIVNPPKQLKRIERLNELISSITRRVAPFYKEGQSMIRVDQVLIDRATGVLADVEDAFEAAHKNAGRARRNLNYLYTGCGAPQ